MAGLSVLMAEWHCMQAEAATMVILSPGFGLGWHILQASLSAPACCLWLKGSGCSMPSPACSPKAANNRNRIFTGSQCRTAVHGVDSAGVHVVGSGGARGG